MTETDNGGLKVPQHIENNRKSAKIGTLDG